MSKIRELQNIKGAPQPKGDIKTHTPGPWVVNKLRYTGNRCIDILAFNPHEPDHVYRHSALAQVQDHTGNHGDWRFRSEEELQANARLIAESPGMLEALKCLVTVNRCECSKETVEAALELAEAVIARIENKAKV